MKNIFTERFRKLDGVSGNSIDVSIWLGKSPEFKDNKQTLMECIIDSETTFFEKFILVFCFEHNVCLNNASEYDDKRSLGNHELLELMIHMSYSCESYLWSSPSVFLSI